MLHTVNKSPFEKNSLSSCINHAAEGAAVLLIEDGVYGAMDNTAASAMVKEAMGKITFYVLSSDAKARGIADKVMEGVNMVDYAGFVDLACENGTVQSWL